MHPLRIFAAKTTDHPPRKNDKTIKILLLILIIVALIPIVLFGGCVACSAIAGSQQNDTIKVGESFTLDTGEYTVTGIRCGDTPQKTRYLIIDYTATNTTNETQILDIKGSLYAPDGHSVNEANVATLNMLNKKTSDSLVMPGTSIDGSEAFCIVGDGEYTCYVGFFDSEKRKFNFTVSNSNAADSSNVKIDY